MSFVLITLVAVVAGNPWACVRAQHDPWKITEVVEVPVIVEVKRPEPADADKYVKPVIETQRNGCRSGAGRQNGQCQPRFRVFQWGR